MNSPTRPELLTRLRTLLQSGPIDAASACAHLDISQPTFSRLRKAAGHDIVTLGAARSTRYAMTRQMRDMGSAFPIYEVQPDGSASVFGELRTLESGWTAFVPNDSPTPYIERGLPYFLQDLRPQGFMGRLVPLTHSELHLPAKIRDWSDDDTLAYIARRGENMQGNLVIGNESYRRYLSQRTVVGDDTVPTGSRATVYPHFAHQVNQGTLPASSAGGEQPKFTTAIMRENGDVDHVIVKFSAPIDTPNGRRWADLLIAEHLALESLRAHQVNACRSEIIIADSRVYLEVVRFDRIGLHGRVPIVSLTGIDCLLAALDKNWTSSTRLLLDAGQLPEAHWNTVRLLEVYGALIGNSDRHPGNLSLHWQANQRFTLAPCYDMLPMMYQPNRQGEIVEQAYSTTTLDPLDLRCLPQAIPIAEHFWASVIADTRISDDFKHIARAHVLVITTLH